MCTNDKALAYSLSRTEVEYYLDAGSLLKESAKNMFNSFHT